MNILPKKRWHVRTKDNIARVRRDEAEAAEQERKRIEKLEYAESEARLNVLRSKAGATTISVISKPEDAPIGSLTNDNGHVNLFSDLQSHVKTTNKEHEKEKKQEQEKYEKQIGYLTYLGQDTNEALKLRSWYELPPSRGEVGERNISEKDLKVKHLNDPLTLMKILLPEEKVVKKLKEPSEPGPIREDTINEVSPKVKKQKKDKKTKKDKKKNKKEKHLQREEKHLEEVARKKELIDRLRKERLKREARERARQEELLCPKIDKPKPVEQVRGPRIVQKYNSQFNPELAKQNMA